MRKHCVPCQSATIHTPLDETPPVSAILPG